MSTTRLVLLWSSLTAAVLTTLLQLWSPLPLVEKIAPYLGLAGLLSLVCYVLVRRNAPKGVMLPALLWAGLMAGLGLRVLAYVLTTDIPDRLGLDLYSGRAILEGLNPYAYRVGEVLGGGLRVGDADLEQMRTLAAGSAAITSWLTPFAQGEITPTTPLLALPFLSISQALTPETSQAWFALLLVADVLTLALLFVLMRMVGRAPGWALLFWVNPVWLVSAFAQGSPFVLLAPLVALVFWAAVSERSALAGIILAWAAGFSLWLAFLLPLTLRTAGRRPSAWRRSAYGLVGFIMMGAGLWALHLFFGAPIHWFGTQALAQQQPGLLFAELFGLNRFDLILWGLLGLVLSALTAWPSLPDQAQRAARAGALGFALLVLTGLNEPLALAAAVVLLPLARSPALVLASGFGLLLAVVPPLQASLWGQPFDRLATLLLGIVILLWMLWAALASFRRNRALE